MTDLQSSGNVKTSLQIQQLIPATTPRVIKEYIKNSNKFWRDYWDMASRCSDI